MDKILFEKIDPVVDEIAECISELIEGNALDSLKQKLVALSAQLGPYSLALDFNLQVFDPNREHTLPLLQMGLATSEGKELYQAWGDSTPHRYIVNGQMSIVPHDRCPSCWAEWDFKTSNPVCEFCGIEMGKDVKLLLDSDCCPNCENGKITMNDPQCHKCGFQVNPDHVIWG